jgi:hypothetical protein
VVLGTRVNSVSNYVKADELMRQRNAEPLLRTGFPLLDQLVGGLREGQSYLFYGASGFVDEFVHQLMVRASAGGKVAYMNNTDYYSEKTLVRPDRITFHAKRHGFNPDLVLEQIYFVAAYNELRQEKAVSALVKMVTKEPTTRLVIIHNIARFLHEAKARLQAIDSLNRVLAPMWRIVAEKDLILVMTAFPSNANQWRIPKSLGSNMMWHLANVMVFFREADGGRTVLATLVKHPSKATLLTVPVLQGDDPLMGRVTPSYRQTYQEFLERIRKNYVEMLRDEGHREAFEALLREAWDREHAAMANSELPLVLDALNLTANLHNQSEIQRLERRLEELEKNLRFR